MNILHIGPLSVHTHRVIRLFQAHTPAPTQQELVLMGEQPLSGLNFDLAIIHHAQDLMPHMPDLGIPMVAWLWNEQFLGTAVEETVRTHLQRAALTIGPVDGAYDYDLKIRPLVDADIFKSEDGTEENITFFFARLGTQDQHNLYWSREVAEALQGIPFHTATGHLAPQSMAQHYRRSKCILATREDAGPSYTVVEACLSGKVPIVSDTPAIRQHFMDAEGNWCGAIGVKKSAESIRAGLVKCLALKPETKAAWAQRNAEYFRDWTLQAQAPKLVEAVSELCK